MVVVEVEADAVDHLDVILAAGGRRCVSGRSEGGGGSPAREEEEEAAVAVKERIARALRLYKEAAGDGGGGWLVQCYGSGEYARISYALIYDIQGSLALPVLDPATASCLAVLELVTAAPLLRVSGELANLCNALQAVSLRGVGICNPAAAVTNRDAARAAMAEVSELLAAVCEAHRLPLAQAWLFLPPDCTGVAEQKAAVDAVSATINACSGDLKAIAISNLEDLFLDSVADGDQQLRHEMDDLGDDQRCSDEDDLLLAVENATIGELKIQSEDQIRGEVHGSQAGKNKTRRGKTEKSITLEELQKYFSGSLKDAARSLGVCPTTMKRICRQHGIPRWPFRKISKVNRSLDKMKRVMESVNCSPSPPVAMPAHPALLLPPPPAPAPPPPPRPCLSSTLGEASSHGSCQAPPPAKAAALARPPRRGNGDGVVTIKASYRGDIVRFRVPCSAGVAAVKAEVAKRLSLDAGGFDVKYLDDDHEWVLLSCDADFQECLDVVPALPSMSAAAAAKSGSGAAVQVVRLMVQEVADNIGSSCASSD
uniref:RWP-RK domain-containing protein n=1 Tax=Oryza brachyantha TaxID=4533 RepID=J3L9F5_ORYBR